MLVHRRVTPQQYVGGSHLYTWVKRDKGKESSLSKETTRRPRLEPQISRFRGVNHSATHASTEFVKEVINYYYYCCCCYYFCYYYQYHYHYYYYYHNNFDFPKKILNSTFSDELTGIYNLYLPDFVLWSYHVTVF